MDDAAVSYRVGEPITHEEMHRMVAEEQSGGELLFDDPPTGGRKYALINLAGPRSTQKSTHPYLRITAVTGSKDAATRLTSAGGKYDTVLVEMYKFLCYPLPPVDASQEDVDAELTLAVERGRKAQDEHAQVFEDRKKAMLEDMARQNAIARSIADGDLEAESMESASVCPESVGERGVDEYDEQGQDEGDLDDCDDVPCAEKFGVLTTLATTVYGDVDGFLFKISGAFVTEAEATAHMNELKQDSRYKSYDVTVVTMGGWLRMPPPAELIMDVVYDTPKLTEAIGSRKVAVNLHDSGLVQSRELLDPVPS